MIKKITILQNSAFVKLDKLFQFIKKTTQQHGLKFWQALLDFHA